MASVARRAILGLVWFGAALLVVRSVDIFIEFNLGLTGVWDVPAEERDNYLHLARWFMFFWLPCFVLGAVAWTGLAWTYSRGSRAGIGVDDFASSQSALRSSYSTSPAS